MKILSEQISINTILLKSVQYYVPKKGKKSKTRQSNWHNIGAHQNI